MGSSNKAANARQSAQEYMQQIESLAEAHKRLVEQTCSGYDDNDDDDASMFLVRDLARHRYGDGGFLAIGLMMTGAVALLHFRGDYTADEFASIKDQMRKLTEALCRHPTEQRSSTRKDH